MMDTVDKKRAGGRGIPAWPEGERPREKLWRNGEQGLSDAELLAIVLRTGTRGKTALDLARELLSRFGGFRAMADTAATQWRDINGLGAAKVAQIKAALEIGRRFRECEAVRQRQKITGPEAAAALLMPRLRDLKTEVVMVMFLDAQQAIISNRIIARGSVNQVFPFVREIIVQALQEFAVSMICAHNHPSGDCQPSEQDRQFTWRLRDAAEILQVPLVDHLIIGNDAFFSFARSGLLAAGNATGEQP